jgi:hypothetical protein
MAMGEKTPPMPTSTKKITMKTSIAFLYGIHFMIGSPFPLAELLFHSPFRRFENRLLGYFGPGEIYAKLRAKGGICQQKEGA